MGTIKENIGLILKRKSLTFSTLALKLGTSAQNVHAQLGREYPNLEILYRIAGVLGVSISEILEGPSEVVVIACPHCGSEIKVIVKG